MMSNFIKCNKFNCLNQSLLIQRKIHVYTEKSSTCSIKRQNTLSIHTSARPQVCNSLLRSIGLPKQHVQNFLIVTLTLFKMISNSFYIIYIQIILNWLNTQICMCVCVCVCVLSLIHI